MAILALSSGNLKNFESRRLGSQALYSSDACAEEAFLRLKNDPLYGGGEVSFSTGICHIDISSSGSEYILQVYFSSDQKYWRPIEVHIINTAGVFSMTSWKEKNINVQ